MRGNQRITTALLVAAVAATACSKNNETQTSVTPEPQFSAKMTTVAMTNDTPKKVVAIQDAIARPTSGSFSDGEAAYTAGKYEDAVKLFEQYTDERPKNPWGHYMLGLSAWKAGDLEKSEKSFNEALRLDPDHFKSLLHLSRVLVDQKRYDDAVVRLTHAGELDPNSADVQRLLGRALVGQNKSDDAVAAYRRTLELDAKDVWSMNNLGSLLIEKERYDEALPVLQKAVSLRKSVAVFHDNLGLALEHTGDIKGAAAEYRKALIVDSGYEKAKEHLTRAEGLQTDAR
jgi:tetratricopeptide (TPR) repeat protein